MVSGFPEYSQILIFLQKTLLPYYRQFSEQYNSNYSEFHHTI